MGHGRPDNCALATMNREVTIRNEFRESKITEKIIQLAIKGRYSERQNPFAKQSGLTIVAPERAKRV
jgi:hypothetical protein